jgi:hypothetical protein
MYLVFSVLPSRPTSLMASIKVYVFFIIHVRCVPCHHSMARPQVADGGDSLQLWRVAANIWTKQSRTADKGWSSS